MEDQLPENDKKLQRFSNWLLGAAVLFFIFGAGYRLGEYQAKKPQVQSAAQSGDRRTLPLTDHSGYASSTDMTLFWQVWGLINEKYADQTKVKTEQMVYGAIKGLVASLGDPYSYFLTPDENKQSKNDLGGKYEGIGAELGMKDNRIIVVAPLNNSPAEKAGLKSGDIIVGVDDKPTRGWTITEAVNHIRGEGNTKVKLSLIRGNKELALNILRQQIKVESVKLSYQKLATCEKDCVKAAYVKVSQFGDNTPAEWDKSMREVKQKWEKKEINGLVVDMRGNPGGYLDAAVYLASEFLPKGSLIVKQEFADRPAHDYLVTRVGTLPQIPVVILINEGSASAAEIFSGALRDYDRAELVGKKSFGKGSVQEALDMSDNTGLHLTIAKWVLPKGDWINGKGIMPDHEVTLEVEEGNTIEDNTDSQLQKALGLLL